MVKKIAVVSLYGGLGAVVRYLIQIIVPLSSFWSVTIINMLAIIVMAITEPHLNLNQREKYHTGFLGGFSTLSSLYLLNIPIIGIVINVGLGLSIYELLKQK